MSIENSALVVQIIYMQKHYSSSAGRTGEVILELAGNMMSCRERGTKGQYGCVPSQCV
jgi:hypothetical protein